MTENTIFAGRMMQHFTQNAVDLKVSPVYILDYPVTDHVFLFLPHASQQARTVQESKEDGIAFDPKSINIPHNRDCVGAVPISWSMPPVR